MWSTFIYVYDSNNRMSQFLIHNLKKNTHEYIKLRTSKSWRSAKIDRLQLKLKKKKTYFKYTFVYTMTDVE